MAAFANSGGIRTGLPEGEVRYEQAFGAQPFGRPCAGAPDPVGAFTIGGEPVRPEGRYRVTLADYLRRAATGSRRSRAAPTRSPARWTSMPWPGCRRLP